MLRKMDKDGLRPGLETIAASAKDVDIELKKLLKERAGGPASKMYGMLEYFMGFRDENLEKISIRVGKRFRPGLTLFLAEGYKARKRALSAALSIELFHNFTLIHDDIVDRDEKRRGRFTVWKLWGADHAINSGDVLSLIASELCLRAEKDAGSGMGEMLLKAYREVGAGQYLDFELAKKPIGKISEKEYLDMIMRKTGVLVAASAEAAGISGKKNNAERKRLRLFGESLGIAYQIADDYRSTWATEEETGKDVHGDVRERKRTLPVISAYAALPETERQELSKLYDLGRPLTSEEVLEAKRLIDLADVKADVHQFLAKYVKRAKKAAHELAISEKFKNTLENIVDELSGVARG